MIFWIHHKGWLTSAFFPSTLAFYTSSWVAYRHCAPCTSLQELIIGFSEMLWALLFSHGRHEISHNANIYTMDIGNHYPSGFCVFIYYHRTSSWIVNHLPSKPCLSSFLTLSLPPFLSFCVLPFPPSFLSLPIPFSFNFFFFPLLSKASNMYWEFWQALYQKNLISSLWQFYTI